MCLPFEKRVEKPEKKTAEKGVQEFSLEVVFFVDGDCGKDTEGLSQNRKAAKGNKESNQCQPETNIIGRLTQQICPVCHFQQTAAKALQSFGGKRQNTACAGEMIENACLFHGFGYCTKQNQIAADEQDGIYGIGNGIGENFCQRRCGGRRLVGLDKRGRSCFFSTKTPEYACGDCTQKGCRQ